MQMRERSSIECGGSITVFLSFLLIFMMSFIFTVLEGARITAAKAKLSMLSELASDSLAGEYYYPLFKEYGFLAVDAGYGKTEADMSETEKELLDFLSCSYGASADNMLGGDNARIELEAVGTLLNSESAGIREQIRDQALYEGVEYFLESFTQNEMFKHGKVLSEVYDRQVDTMEAAAAVTKEILRLMTLVDGIATTENGLYADENGNLAVEPVFLKSFGVKDEAYMRRSYGNLIVFDTVRGSILYVTDLVKDCIWMTERVESEEADIVFQRNLMEKLEKTLKKNKEELDQCEELKAEKKEELTSEKDPKERGRLKDEIDGLSEEIRRLKEIETEKTEAHREGMRLLKELEVKCESTKSDSMELYALIRRMTENGFRAARDAYACLTQVRLKQEIAERCVDEYEDFLESIEGLPGEIAEGLMEDVLNLKAYATLEKCGYDTEGMMQTLQNDIFEFSMAATKDLSKLFAESPDVFGEMREELKRMQSHLDLVNYDKLKFNYTGLKSDAGGGENIKETFLKGMAGGLLKYVGVKDISDKELNGLELPSGGAYGGNDPDLFSKFSEMGEFFKDSDPAKMLEKAGEKLTSDFLTEVWMADHFSDYTEQFEDTKLAYEREYVLCGKKSDPENLASAVLKLTALRAVFTFSSLLADGERNGQATALASTISGFTGIPALLYAVKYMLLTVWAVEEALVEVSALLMGKKVPIFSPKGNIRITEILTMTGTRVQAKAASISDNPPGGVGYMQYITVLSFFEDLKKKEMRIADLVQENIRLKYRDTFRMKNAITDWRFTATVDSSVKFDTGFFDAAAYKTMVRTERSY